MELIIKTLIGLNIWSVMFRLFMAAVFGGCIGLERGRHNRAAGLRTHILVCVGSAVTVLVGLYTAQTLGFNNDPMRIGAQVVSGIGFLGAGTILHHDHTQITGLTTAAGLWTTASIGLAIGTGAYCIALVAFIIMIITVILLGRMDCFSKKTSTSAYYLELESIIYINDFSERIKEQVPNLLYGLEIIPAKSGLIPHVGVMLTVSGIYDEQLFLENIRKIDELIAAVPVSIQATQTIHRAHTKAMI